MLQAIVGLLTALAVVWLLFAIAVTRARPAGGSVGELMRLLPHMLRLLRGLSGDRSLPRAARWRLRLALAYNVQPINLIPDFIPVVGLVDNVVIVLWALRGAARLGGPETVARHWRGTPETLELLYRWARLDGSQKSGRPWSKTARSDEEQEPLP